MRLFTHEGLIASAGALPLTRLRLAVILLAVVDSAAAQTNLERVVNGCYTPSHDYDLIHQRIEVRNFDWDSTSFDGRVTTTSVALRAGSRRRHPRHGPQARGPRRHRRPTRRSGSTARATRSSCGSRAPPHSATRCGSPWTITAASPRATGSTSSRTSRPAAPAAAGVQRRRHRRESALDPHLGRPGRQGHLGSRRHRSRAAHRGLQRPPGERPAVRRARGRCTGRQEKPASTYLISPRRGAVRPDRRAVARHPARVLRLSRGQRARAGRCSASPRT